MHNTSDNTNGLGKTKLCKNVGKKAKLDVYRPWDDQRWS